MSISIKFLCVYYILCIKQKTNETVLHNLSQFSNTLSAISSLIKATRLFRQTYIVKKFEEIFNYSLILCAYLFVSAWRSEAWIDQLTCFLGYTHLTVLLHLIISNLKRNTNVVSYKLPIKSWICKLLPNKKECSKIVKAGHATPQNWLSSKRKIPHKEGNPADLIHEYIHLCIHTNITFVFLKDWNKVVERSWKGQGPHPFAK